MRTYSQKQANVIYRAFKEGLIDISKSAISKIYDMVGDVEVYNTNQLKGIEEEIYAVRLAVGFIFDNDYKRAEKELKVFA